MLEVKNMGQPAGEMLQGQEGDSLLHELAPRLDWKGIGEAEHFVQFYETDTFLLDSLSGFVGAGLGEGDACIVVATKEHRDGLEERLQRYGLDVSAATASGQFIALDASETLSEFMVAGEPEPVRFAEAVGGIITRAAEGRSRVRIFGEMVALLWAEGKRSAALRLEELWNDLHKIRTFSLYCAYPLNGFGGEMLAAGLQDVCAAHSRLIPAESYTALTNRDDRLRTIIELQQKARTLEAEIAVREQAIISERLARVEAEQANRLKDEFLATVSHELRTPLNAIIGWTHMVRTGSLDEATVSRAIETIERNARAQAQLIEDILDVSRVITGKLRLNIEPVDVAAVINAAIDSVQLAADSKGIQLEVTLSPAARHVSGDASRLQQVVWNLLSNAIKFTPEGGRVSVRLERAGADAKITVQDTGEGINRDFLPFIFDRFRQADGTSTRIHGGLGLGLAIVRHLVEVHGGTIEAESQGEGLGAQFTIRLPLASAKHQAKGRRSVAGVLQPREDAADAHVHALPSLEGVKVLLVDDDPDTISMLAVVLTDARAVVQTASSAAAALEALQWYKPDVLVSDLAMPGEDGFSLIEKLRMLEATAERRTPAVALTAYVRVEDRARALSAGFNMFVPKPIEPNELITAISNLVEPGTPPLLLSHSETM